MTTVGHPERFHPLAREFLMPCRAWNMSSASHGNQRPVDIGRDVTATQEERTPA